MLANENRNVTVGVFKHYAIGIYRHYALEFNT